MKQTTDKLAKAAAEAAETLEKAIYEAKAADTRAGNDIRDLIAQSHELTSAAIERIETVEAAMHDLKSNLIDSGNRLEKRLQSLADRAGEDTREEILSVEKAFEPLAIVKRDKVANGN